MKILKKLNDSIWKIKITCWWQLGNFFMAPKPGADLKKLMLNHEIKHILISELNFIGDQLLITPTIRALKTQYPDVQITVLSKNKLTQSVLKNNPNIDQFALASSYWQILIFSLKNRSRFDLLIDYSANFYFAFLLNFAKIPYRIGAKPLQKIFFKNQDGFGWLYTHTKPFPANAYLADYFLSLLEFLGVKSQDNSLEINLGLKEYQKAHDLLKQKKLIENQFLVMHPGVNDPGKAWSLANWRQLAQILSSRQKIVFSGSVKDRQLIARICKDLDPNQAINLAGKLKIRETAALISLAQGFIGVDTGPLHIAVALNKPTIAIFNTTHPQNYLPPRNNIMALDTPENCKQHFTLDYIKTQKQYHQPECTNYIIPEQVYEAIQKLLK